MKNWDGPPRDYSFGKYLQGIRLSRHIRLDDLSRATCIGIDNLIRLESDDLAHLPAEVFVVGYIRTYAKAVGADPEEALRRYQAHRQALKAQIEWELRRSRASQRFWQRLGFAVCLLAVVIAASIYFMSPDTPLSSGTSPSRPERDDSGAGASFSPPDTMQQGAPAPGSPVRKTEKDLPKQPEREAGRHHQYRLDIWAVKDLWLKAIVDDQQAQVYKLKKGDTLHLEALTGINLLIEDAAGVELTLDGTALPVPGKAGQVVNLEIP